MSKKIEIDIELLAQEMAKDGHPDSSGMEGWTEGLIDILEDKYNLETLIMNEIMGAKP